MKFGEIPQNNGHYAVKVIQYRQFQYKCKTHGELVSVIVT